MHDLFRSLCSPHILIKILLLLPFATAAATGQQSIEDSVTTIGKLNQQLIQISGRRFDAQATTDANAAAMLRRDLLLAELRASPEKVKGLLLPPDAVSVLPPSVRALIEYKTEEQGTLYTVVEDYAGKQRLRYFLQRNGGPLETYFLTENHSVTATGTQVRVSAYRLENALLVDNNELEAVSMAPASPTFGQQNTAVLLVNFQNDPQEPYSTDQARDVVFNTTSNFFLENSQNQTWLAGDVFDWITIPLSSSTCPTLLTLANSVDQAAAAANINLGNYRRHIFIFPHFACDWIGASSFGGNPSVSAINGALSMSVIGHEMGHGFSLLHSHSLVCVGVSVGNNCTVDDYGDRFDIMGEWTASHFNAFQKERLGWLNYGSSLPTITANVSGNYTIAPYETSQGAKAIEVLKNNGAPVGQRSFYYIEYRQLIGFDNVLAQYPASTTGVLVRSGTENDPDSSLLLNMNPQDSSFAHAALPVGQSFVDTNAGVSITTVSLDSSSATVNIDVSGGTGGCHRNSPLISVSPSHSAPVSPGALVHYSVTITDQDSVACLPSSFLLVAPTVAAGWTAVTATNYFTLGPGQSGNTDLQVTSPSTAVAGDYTIGVTAVAWPDYSYRSSTSTTYTVSGAPVPDFVLSVTPASITVPRGLSTTLMVSSAAIGGFSSGVTLSAAGTPSGVTAQFSPTAIAAGSGTSTLTVTAGDSALLGNSTIMVTGMAGTLSHAAPLVLTVTGAPASLASIAITPTSPTLNSGSSLQFHATGTYSNGSTADITTQVTWTSDTPSVASINSAGLALATNVGSTRIYASLAGITASTSLTVTSAPANTYTLLGNSIPATQDMRYAQGVEVGLKFTSDVTGSVTAIRFFKSANAFGTHVGELWTIGGQRLASVTFTNESTTGWQQVSLPASVPIQANTPYVVSYHSDGPFSYVDFPASIDKPPLHAPASALGGNGVYALGAVGTFPGLGGGLNYLVDVVFTTTPSNATLTSIQIAPQTPSVLAGSALQFHATGTYSNGSTADITNQVTWASDTPGVAAINNAGLANAISAGAARISASLGAISSSTTLTVTGTSGTSYSLFGNSSPVTQDMRYAQGVEVGLKFVTDVSGSIIAIRFYKSRNAFGGHVGELWTIGGQRLASATFTNETSYGWQQVTLNTPVRIQANTPYVVSYHSDGPFSYVDFPTSIDMPPLHAPVSGPLGGNGVYALGPSGSFPGLGGGTNYLVDVVFVP